MRVLLVEDEVNLAENVRRSLVAEGFAVQVEHDGESGLRTAAESQFDAIILDIMLPRLSGYEVLRRLRKQGSWVPVLMLTAKDGVYDQTDAFELGADDYLTKPFSTLVLAARLRALSRRRPEARSTVLTVGGLQFDPQRRVATRGDAELELTPREMGLLEYLMRNAGHVVSKHDILTHVWDPAYEGPEAVVEVYIGYLRRKIDAPFGLATIHTRRGLGYQMGPERPAADS